jgi:hypothetical protein
VIGTQRDKPGQGPLSWKGMGGPRHFVTCAVSSVSYKTCPAFKKRQQRHAVDLTGVRVGHLRVLTYAGWYAKTSSILWLCQCDCEERTVVRTSTLRHSKQVTCLCHMHMVTHGHTRRALHNCQSPTYVSYWAMRSRCFHSKNIDYKFYGGRGITVCERWLGKQGFINFLADMGPRPRGKTLDRKNPNGNYEPGNCRWATNHTQAKNKRPRRVKGSPTDIHSDVASITGMEEIL